MSPFLIYIAIGLLIGSVFMGFIIYENEDTMLLFVPAMFLWTFLWPILLAAVVGFILNRTISNKGKNNEN